MHRFSSWSAWIFVLYNS